MVARKRAAMHGANRVGCAERTPRALRTSSNASRLITCRASQGLHDRLLRPDEVESLFMPFKHRWRCTGFVTRGCRFKSYVGHHG